MAAYASDGSELLAPRVCSPAAAAEALWQFDDPVALGDAAELLPGTVRRHRHPHTDLPHAISVARLAQRMPVEATVRPLYVRNDVATRPSMPPNPLSGETDPETPRGD